MGWATTAPAEAWQHAAGMNDPAARTLFQNVVLAVWSRQDPESAFSAVVALPKAWPRDEYLREVITELARQNPQRAIEMLKAAKLPDAGTYYWPILAEWARNDVQGAVRWAESQPANQRRGFAQQLAPAYASQFPDEALAWAQRIDGSVPRSLYQRNVWASAIAALALQDPQSALARATAVENPAQRVQAITQVLNSIATADPALAISHLDKVPPGRERFATITHIANQLAITDPVAAIEWLTGLDDSSERENGMRQIAGSIAYRNTEVAAQLVDRVPATSRTQWIAAVALAYVQNDTGAAMDWMRKYQNDPAYSAVLRRVAPQLVMQDPEFAFELVRKSSDGALRDPVVLSMLEQQSNMVLAGALQDPRAAIDLLPKIADESMRALGTATIASAWMRADADAARKWVMGLEIGLPRDRAMVQVVSTNPRTASGAITLINQIQSDEQRMRAVMWTAVQLNSVNAEEARILLRRYPLDLAHQKQYDAQLQQIRTGYEYNKYSK